MLTTIKTVLFNYAVCAFTGGILEYIAPDKTKKTLRVVVVSVLLLCIVSPVVKGNFNYEGLFNQTEFNENTSYDALMHTANLTERRLREEIKSILINEGINEYEIYISTSVNEEENTVYLEEIKIEIGGSFYDKISVVKNKIPEEYKSVLKVGVKNE